MATANVLVERVARGVKLKMRDLWGRVRSEISEARKLLVDAMGRLPISFIFACLAFGASFFILDATDMARRVEEGLRNGWGPYQVTLLAVVASFYSLLIANGRLPFRRFVKLVLLGCHLTFIDALVLGVIVWGLGWGLCFARSPQCAALSQGLNYVMSLANASWKLALVWSFWRAGYVSFTSLRGVLSAEEAPRRRLFQDRPLETISEDALRREEVVNRIVELVRDFDHAGSLVLGVTGDWGAGKTTVINFALEQLRDHKSVVVVEFDPWSISVGNEDRFDPILKSFFDTLNGAIQSHAFRPNLSRLIRKYYKLLSPLAEKAFIDLDFIFADSDDANRLRRTRDDIDCSLSNLDATLLVVIDDLDRMAGLEIAYIFKLARLCASFDNVIYILAFDRNFVEHQLEAALNLGSTSEAQDYVDKIIQLELPLPKVDPDAFFEEVLKSYLRRIEKELAVDLLADKSYSERLGYLPTPHLVSFVSNVRLAKLLLNRYWQVLTQLKGEVNYFDLLILEVIRFRHPDVYETIYLNQTVFTSETDAQWPFGQEPEDRRETLGSLIGETNGRSTQSLLHLLGSVFPAVRSYHEDSSGVVYRYPPHRPTFQDKSAAHFRYLPRYFYYAVQRGMFSDVYWDDFIHHLNDASPEQIVSILHEGISRAVSNGNDPQEWLNRMRASVPRFRAKQIPTLVSALTRASLRIAEYLASEEDEVGYGPVAHLAADLVAGLDSWKLSDVLKTVAQDASDVDFLRSLHSSIQRMEQTVDSEPLKHFEAAVASRLRRQYLSPGRSILEDNHGFGGLYALKLFLEPQDYRPYLEGLVERETRQAFLLLGSLSTDTDLEYRTLKSLIEPQVVLKAVKNTAEQRVLSDQESRMLEALRFGIAEEEAGTKFTHIEERPGGGFIAVNR